MDKGDTSSEVWQPDASISASTHGTTEVKIFSIEIVPVSENPDRGYSQSGDVGHLLLDTGKVPSPVGLPVGLSRIVQAGALRWVVLHRIAVKKRSVTT